MSTNLMDDVKSAAQKTARNWGEKYPWRPVLPKGPPRQPRQSFREARHEAHRRPDDDLTKEARENRLNDLAVAQLEILDLYPTSMPAGTRLLPIKRHLLQLGWKFGPVHDGKQRVRMPEGWNVGLNEDGDRAQITGPHGNVRASAHLRGFWKPKHPRWQVKVVQDGDLNTVQAVVMDCVRITETPADEDGPAETTVKPTAGNTVHRTASYPFGWSSRRATKKARSDAERWLDTRATGWRNPLMWGEG